MVSVKQRGIYFGVAIFALTAVWSLMTPLFSGPDEPANYIKSAAVIRGEWVGSEFPPSLQMSYWTTYVHVNPQFGTPNLIPWQFASFGDRPGYNIAIEDAPANDVPTWTNMGRYPVLPFIFSGIGTLLGPNDMSARVARLMTSAICALLLAMAATTMKRRHMSSVGVLMAVVPGTLFLASSMNPSAIEICAAIALWTVAPTVLSDIVEKWSMFVFTISGTFLILTRPLGPALYALILLLSYIAASERPQLRHYVLNHWRVFSLHLVGILFAAWWYLSIYSFELSTKLTAEIPSVSLRSQIGSALHHIPALLDQAVGNFGWLDSPMPRGALMVFVVAFLVVIGRGLLSMTMREKMASSILVVATLLLVVAQDLNYYSLLRNFGSQGRHIAPLLVGLPILASAAFVWSRKREFIAAMVWGLTMVWAGLGALRRYTVGINGDNALDMLRNRSWNPVLGFWPTVTMLMLSTVAVVCLIPYNRPPAK
ncbi:MAG: DUF2142 domain-containing protein [Actinobacteria bacterium]|nr:MAG: DUF2142 domain-containing protein [Actinomycetota bacterium]